MNEVITSVKNPHVIYLRSLQQKKYRDAEGKFIIEGLRFVEEAVKSGAAVEEIILRDDMLEAELLLKEHMSADIDVTLVADHVLRKISDTENPQGIAAVVRKTEHQVAELFVDKSFVVIVDRIQDPGNLGTIIRTADAANVTGIILIKGTADLYNPKTLRSTMGSVFHLPIIIMDSIEEALTLVRDYKLKIMVTDIGGAATPYLNADFLGPTALVLGNEAQGVGDIAGTEADQRVIINMPGKAESLNVAVAAGILLFEMVRQRSIR